MTDHPEMFQAYLKYVESMVKHFKDRGAYIEIGNEWNAWTPDFFMSRFFEPTYAAIKRSLPTRRSCSAVPQAWGPADPWMPRQRREVHRAGDRKSTPSDGTPATIPMRLTSRRRELQDDCRALGFKGKFFATEIYAGMSYPPGPVAP